MNPVLLGMLLLLLISACFSGAEAALFTLAAEGDRRRRVPLLARGLLKDQAGVLSSILLANLVSNLSFFASTHHWAAHFSTSTRALTEIAAILAIVVFGEILPKVVAHRFPRITGEVFLLPVVAAHFFLGPVLRPFRKAWAATRVKENPMDSGEAADLLEEERQGILERTEMELVSHLLELGELRAGALRRPLTDVPQVVAEQPLDEALAWLEKTQQSWAAVMDATGEMLGVLDRVRLPQGVRVLDAMRRVPVLPEVAPVANGVQLLQRSGGPCVLLVDEYGLSVGIIQRGRWADTLLDRLPTSAFSDSSPIRLGKGGHWEVDAALPLHDFQDRFGDPGLAAVRVDTIGGLVAEKLGRMATEGDQIVWQHGGQRFSLRVLRCAETRPLLLAVTVKKAEGQDPVLEPPSLPEEGPNT